MTRVDGTKFNAGSVSLDSWTGPDTIEITGERPDGSTVQQLFTTDSSLRAEPVALVGFTGLTSLRFSAVGSTPFAGIFGQIDDLVVALWQNQPPVADAGPDQIVFLGEFVQLDGTGSYDPDGDPIIGWVWDFESTPPGSGVALTSRLSRTPGFSPDLLGEYVLSLIVASSEDPSSPAFVTITVIENQPPVAGILAHPIHQVW